MTKRMMQASSIKEVAALAGVSIATVSRVVNGVANKASDETAERVRKAIVALDYRPTSAGRDLRRRTSRLVAVLAANLANPAMTAIAASAEAALRENGLVMVLCDTHDQPELQDEYIREMLAQQARAIVLLGAVDSFMLRRAQESSIPLVFVNRRAPDGLMRGFIGIDNRRAGEDVARWALARGLRNAALIHAPILSSATRERVQGILAGFAAAGAPLHTKHVLAPHAPDHLHIGKDAALDLISRSDKPDLVICTSDLIAFGVARAWREALPGQQAPRLIGFDDSPMNEWLAPSLNSVRIPYAAYGRAIVEAILGDDRNTTIVLEHQIIERQT
ncbi:MAG: LacI family DNA-binding transcriptional regulator [Beijerinckiaceae bacterium]|nr:LacI family DNA-binding transcriptional regulator [Beijerinckiaceae bacterium]MCZ8301799.1 LacI family DNA-binding transcriptional regulator [Beijerinckiaceae bacterium]